MSTSTPIVDADGNITIHVLEDLKIELISSAESSSLAGLDLFFEVVNTDISVELADHPTEVDGRLISIPAEILAPLNPISSFAVVDRSGEEIVVRWAGRLTKFTEPRLVYYQPVYVPVVEIQDRGVVSVATSIEGQAAIAAMTALDQIAAMVATHEFTGVGTTGVCSGYVQ